MMFHLLPARLPTSRKDSRLSHLHHFIIQRTIVRYLAALGSVSSLGTLISSPSSRRSTFFGWRNLRPYGLACPRFPVVRGQIAPDDSWPSEETLDCSMRT